MIRDILNPFRRILVYALLLILVVLTIFPIYWMVGNSLKQSSQFFLDDVGLPSNPTLQWYADVLNPKIAGINILRAYFNTLIYFGITAPLVAFLAAMLGFAFTYYTFRGKAFTISYVYLGMAIPPQVPLVTIYVYMFKLGLVNTVPGLLLLYTAAGISFNTFLLYSYFQTIPMELFESAEMDGAVDLKMFLYVGLPLCRPMFYVSWILHGIWVWNEYVLGYSFLTDANQRPVTPMAATILGHQYSSYGALSIPLSLAGLTLVLAPIIVFYVIMNRKIIQGFIQGALGKF